MINFGSAGAEAAFVLGAAAGAFLGILYTLVLLGAGRLRRGVRRRRGRPRTVPPPMSRTMPLRRG